MPAIVLFKEVPRKTILVKPTKGPYCGNQLFTIGGMSAKQKTMIELFLLLTVVFNQT